MEFPRFFTSHLEAGKTPYDEVKWELRTASIGNDKRRCNLRATRRRSPHRLVANRDEYRGQQCISTGRSGRKRANRASAS